MKTLHIITGLETGGAERALYNLLAGGLTKHADTTVLSLRDEGTMGAPMRELGVCVETLGLRASISAPRAIFKLRSLIRALEPNIIQGWMYHGNLAAWLAAKTTPVPTALLWNVRHCIYDLGNEKFLTRQLIRASRSLSKSTDRILYNSQLARDQHESFGFSADKSTVIPNGFDVGKLQSVPTTGFEVRNEFGIEPQVPVVGHIARFHPIKDHAGFLIAAVEVLKHRQDVVFLLVGRDVRPDNPALAGIIPQNLLKNFVFAGERRDIPRLIQAMDLFCLSSVSEAFPNVIGEAMACSVPCVATNVGDSAVIIGDTGQIVPPSDPVALTHALLSMLEKPEDVLKQAGTAARARIVANFSIDKIVDSYMSLYDDLTDVSPSG